MQARCRTLHTLIVSLVCVYILIVNKICVKLMRAIKIVMMSIFVMFTIITWYALLLADTIISCCST